MALIYQRYVYCVAKILGLENLIKKRILFSNKYLILLIFYTDAAELGANVDLIRIVKVVLIAGVVLLSYRLFLIIETNKSHCLMRAFKIIENKIEKLSSLKKIRDRTVISLKKCKKSS